MRARGICTTPAQYMQVKYGIADQLIFFTELYFNITSHKSDRKPCFEPIRIFSLCFQCLWVKGERGMGNGKEKPLTLNP